MGAVEIVPDPTRYIHPFSLDPAALAMAVAAAAILILGLSLAGALADRRVQEHDQRLITAVNNMSHGVVMFNAAERLLVCNERYIEMYGLSADVVKPGVSLQDVIRHRKETGCAEWCRPSAAQASPGGRRRRHFLRCWLATRWFPKGP